MSFGILKPARQVVSKPAGGNFFVDRSHPLARGLLLAIPLGAVGNREIEYIQRIYSVTIAGTSCPIQQNGARYWDDNNNSITSNMVRFNPRTSWINLGTGAYTILSRVFSLKPGPIFSINSYNPNWFVSGAGEGPPANSLMIYDGGYGAYSSSTITLSKWQNIGWVRNSTATNDGYFYINGYHAGTLDHDDTIVAATSLQVGKNKPEADYHHHYGYIDYVYVWNRALSIGEINDFFNNPNQIFSFKGSSVFLAKAPFDGRLLSGSVQSQPATTTGTIETICSLSGNVQSQPATATGTIETICSLSGNVQSQPATATGTITTSDVISLSGSVQSQPATATGTIETICSLSGNVQSQPATATGNIETFVSLSGSVQSQPATATGTITTSDVVSLSGSIQSQPATALSFRLLCIGQSNMSGWDSSQPKLSSDYTNTLMWKNTTARWQQIVAPDATSGNPGTGSSIMHNLNDKLHELTGRVVGSLNTGYGGIGVVKGNSGQEGWSIHTSTPWVQMASKVAATGGAFDCVIHWGGESDVGQLVTREQFRDGLTSLFNNLKTLLNNDLLYMFCVKTSCPDYDDVAVRQGYDDFIAQTNRAIVFEDAANYPVIDTFQHIAKENMALIGAIGGQAIYDWIIAKNKNKVISSLQSQQASLSGVIDTDANNISASLQAQSAILDANINVAIGLSCSLQAQVASLDSSIQVKLLLFGLLQSQQATMTKYHGTVRSSTAQSLSLSLKIGF